MTIALVVPFVMAFAGVAAVQETDSGRADLRGRGWLKAKGTELKFRAHRGGAASLESTGVYKTRRGPIRVWGAGGVEIAIESA